MDQLAKLRDDMDREHLEQVLRSQGYDQIQQRVQGVLVAEIEKCATQDLDPVETAKQRGVIAGLRLALALPTQMLSEYRAKPRQ